MSFLWPPMLLLLLLLPVAVVQYRRARRRRAAASSGYGSLTMSQLSGRPLGARVHIPPALFLVGLALLIVGMARPQATVLLPRVGGTVMIAFDVSGSMAADDVAPSRMEVAKELARTFVAGQPEGVKIGVTAFSEGGLTIQVPTDDTGAVLAAIDRVAPQRGTSVGQGILAALTAIQVDAGETPQQPGAEAPPPAPPETEAPAAIILFSDGENTSPPDPLDAAYEALARGVRIHTVGVGSAAGATLQLEGFSVNTRLDEGALRQISEMTLGSYYGADQQENFGAVYQELTRRLLVKPEELELTALFAGAGVLALLIGGLCSMLWFGRAP